MENFAYERATSVADALRLAQQPGAAFVAGGTNLLDLMKGGVARPTLLVDVTRLPLAAVGACRRRPAHRRDGPQQRSRRRSAGAPARPLLSQALLAGASPQLRNMATVGGNLLQRTRCHYFDDTAFDACNKRRPARAARRSTAATASMPSSAPARSAWRRTRWTCAWRSPAARRGRGAGAGRGRAAHRDDRFPPPAGDAPQLDTTLAPGELIVAVELPPLAAGFAAASHYLKVRDRTSYAFALVSAAVAIDVQGGRVRGAALALGGVAHKPWRLPAAEQARLGRPLDDRSIATAADLLLDGAKPLAENAFKVELARRSIARALNTAAGRA